MEDLTEADLKGLIESKVIESKFIEYKRDLPGNQDRDKKEFLRDMSSFANTAGGYLIFGIEEDQGAPKEIIGIEGMNPDETILRLDEIVRNGLRPQIYGIQYKTVELENGRRALVVKIPDSLNGPHQIVYNTDMRFSARGNAGKYIMPVEEIRDRVEGSGRLTERLRNFRIERIAKISANESFSQSDRPGGRIIVHYLPVRSFGNLELPLLRNGERWPVPPPPKLGNGYSFTGKYCFDGFNFHSTNENGKIEDYFLLYKNGVMELVHFFPLRDDPKDPWRHVIGGSMVEGYIYESISYLHTISKQLNVLPPAFFAITVQGMKGLKWALGEHLGSPSGILDRDLFLNPEVYITDADFNPNHTLKKLVDPIWNAAGWEESPNFKTGTWIMGR